MSPLSVSRLTEVTFCSIIWVCKQAAPQPAKGNVFAADLQSALMLVKYSPPPPTSRQLDRGHSIYTKCSNYSREVLGVRSIMIPRGWRRLAVFFSQHFTLCPPVVFSSPEPWNFSSGRRVSGFADSRENKDMWERRAPGNNTTTSWLQISD